MARSRPSINKRKREKEKAEKRLLKIKRRSDRAAEDKEGLTETPDVDPDVDPDIADIVPGPQKPLW